MGGCSTTGLVQRAFFERRPTGSGSWELCWLRMDMAKNACRVLHQACCFRSPEANGCDRLPTPRCDSRNTAAAGTTASYGQ
eukprot:715577-Amphidinium_carterae.1